MNNALDIFNAVPKTHNCAQSVAAGLGRNDLVDALKSCGGGRAPEGICGALHAAMLLVPEDRREALRAEFVSKLHSTQCRELKQVHQIPCTACVNFAAALVEKYR